MIPIRDFLRRWLVTGSLTARLHDVQPMAHEIAVMTAGWCQLPDCSTCRPAPVLDVVAEERRARDLAYTKGWLIEHYPDCWYFEGPDLRDERRFDAFATGILDLRLRVWDGRLTP